MRPSDRGAGTYAVETLDCGGGTGSAQPPFNQLERCGTGLTEGGERGRHCDRLPISRVGREVAIVSDLIHSSEMPEPDADLWGSRTDGVIRARNSRQRKWKVMSEQQDPVPNLHLV